MAELPVATPETTPVTTPASTASKPMSRHVFGVLALVAVAATVGIWYVFNQTTTETLKIGAGMELKYRKDITDILCQEAKNNHLNIEIQWMNHPLEALQQVENHKLDAAIIPAGCSLAEKAKEVRQVTMLDPQIVHLFVKPEIYSKGLAGLRGRSIFLGAADTEGHYAAEKVLEFIGLSAGRDFVEDTRGYAEMMKSPDSMPDAVFGLSPLPWPLGEKLAGQFGYQLLDLPMGEALALRKPCCEDIVIPADTYGASPPVPQQAIHSVGVRSVLVANAEVPGLAVERLLEVLYESNFARLANVKKLDPALLQRSSNFPTHKGTDTYMRRNDPWIVQKLLTKLQGFMGSVVSGLSAILLAWHWIRRKKVDMGAYQLECTNLDLDAQRAAYQGTFGEAELSACLTQLARLKAEVLEQHHEQFISGDKQVLEIVARIEGLQTLLPGLVRSKAPVKHLSLDFGPPRKAA